MKSVCLKILLLAVVVLGGCGHQDRYEVVSPEVSFVVEDAAWGRVTALPTLENSFDPSPAVVVDGRQYFGARGGLVYAVTPTGYETLPRPDGTFVRSLIKGPDGLLWRSDYNGRIYYFQDGAWQLDHDLDLIWDTRLEMLIDDQNRIVLMGNRDDGFNSEGRRHLWRRETSGQWSKMNIPGDPDIMHGWCEHGLPPVFITGHLELINEGPDGWEISAPLLEDIHESDVEIQGNEAGHQAVRVQGEGFFLLNTGEGWEIMDSNNRLGHLFWLNGELYGIKRWADDLLRWDGEQWIQIHSTPNEMSGDFVWSLANGSDRIVYFEHGGSMVFDGASWTVGTRPLGELSAFVRHNGQDHLYLKMGQHIIGNNGVWEEAGRPFEENNRSSTWLRMVVDDEDRLTFLKGYSIRRWTGSEYLDFPSDKFLRRTYLQDDGKVVVLSGSHVGVWSGGQLRWLGFVDENDLHSYGARWESDERIHVLSGSHLTLVQPNQSNITFTFQGWYPRFMAAGPGRQKMAIGGNERTIVIDGDNITDITPIWGSTHGDAGRLSAMISDGFGGWLAFDHERFRLLRFDGERWSSMGNDFWSAIRDGGTFTSNHDGTFLLQEQGYVFLIEPGVSP